MDMSKVAVQMYSVREFCKTAEDLDKTLCRLKEIGYSAIQCSGIGVDNAKVKELCDKHGMKIVATHYSLDTILDDYDKAVADHKLLGCKYVGLGSVQPSPWQEGFAPTTAYDEFIPRANKAGKMLDEAGMKLVYHNHNFEFEKFDAFGGITAFDKIFNELDECVDMEVDVYWVQAGGANPVDVINKVAGRIHVVHLKDMEIKGNQQRFAPIGTGNLNWPAIIDACEKAGVEWYAIEQDDCYENDPFDCMKKSFDYLSSL